MFRRVHTACNRGSAAKPDRRRRTMGGMAPAFTNLATLLVTAESCPIRNSTSSRAAAEQGRSSIRTRAGMEASTSQLTSSCQSLLKANTASSWTVAEPFLSCLTRGIIAPAAVISAAMSLLVARRPRAYAAWPCTFAELDCSRRMRGRTAPAADISTRYHAVFSAMFPSRNAASSWTPSDRCQRSCTR